MTRDELVALLMKHRDNDLQIAATVYTNPIEPVDRMLTGDPVADADPDLAMDRRDLTVTGVRYDAVSDRLLIDAIEGDPL